MKFTSQIIGALAAFALLGNPVSAQEEIGKCLAEDYGEGCNDEVVLGLEPNPSYVPEDGE